MKKKEKIIIVLFIAIVFFSGIFFFYSKEDAIPITPEKINTQQTNTTGAFLEINGEKYQTEIKDGISVYDFMDKLRSEGKINFVAKNYIGIGQFIEEINGIRGNGDEYWIYYVNGKKSDVGVSDYKIKTGDIVSWNYSK